jgi:WhiB family redox-sensing transcriptional regulator
LESVTHFEQVIASDDPKVWGTLASCKGKPAEWWFADKYNTQQGKEFTAMAKRICRTCLVANKCLQLADEGGEAFGIWGGLTPKERGFKRMTKQF